MSLRRPSGVFFVALCGAVGCSAYPTLKPVPIDCNADSAYDIQFVYTFDTTAGTNFFGSGDNPADGSTTTMPEALTDGDRCGSTSALVLHTAHNNDWGSLFGIYSFGPRDESAYEGLAFWARAPGNTTKAFTVLLDDTNTENLAMPAICSLDAGTPATPVDSGTIVCKNYCIPDGGTGGVSYAVDQNGQIIGGATTNAPPLDACGNSYYVVATVTSGWQFYTFPFVNFRQLAQPNRVPNDHFTDPGNLEPANGLLTSAIMGLTFRMPPEADMNLWLSHLGFYRKKTGGDGGIDAPKDARGE